MCLVLCSYYFGFILLIYPIILIISLVSNLYTVLNVTSQETEFPSLWCQYLLYGAFSPQNTQRLNSNSYYKLLTDVVFYGKFWRQSIQRDRRVWRSMTHPAMAECVNHWPLRERHGDGTLPTYTFYLTTLLLSTKVISVIKLYFGKFMCHLLVLEVVGGMREIVIRHTNCHRI